MRFRSTLSLAALAAALALSPATAQKRQPTPEQRIERLEKQVRQVQKQVFPKGQPADTAGFSDDPAATQESVTGLNGRLDAIERQLSDIVRQSEENGNRVAVMESELARLRADQDRRIRALETAPPTSTEPAQANEDEGAEAPPPPSRPKVEKRDAELTSAVPASATATDPAEAAYDEAFQLWNSGKYDQAIKSLQAFTKKYPDHRRTSWAYNLTGRAMLDKGQPRAAAEALLANYRRDPKGERAQDSLFYLGQALMKLGQPGQACKAYEELEDVYSSSLRAPLKAALPGAKSSAKCS
ncbi:tetratricopeptide repeat protein [Sphingomonas sp. NSE70-1]|uniref:Tetratricopeptide repeat protein n=1 Tax=Sphingomonas caseinilyticus TaxID=2908205 RepID=A0ABT0RW59_9SPHN|nr:tetratricopeptide repeat protein [Sphingomonas caseinilyticus]MCL6699238.1 tetratricopeptide repeat protein [Sphingomonas caseinilyticus]